MSLGSKRILCVIAVIVLMVLSWYTLISDSISATQEYNGYLSVAREKAEYKLYSDAVSYYQQALAMRDSIELRVEIADFYFNNGHIEDFINSCSDIMADYPQDAAGYEKAVSYYSSVNDYNECYSIINIANKRKVVSDYLNSIYNEYAYKYGLSYLGYEDVRIFSAGYCAVKTKEGYWGFINQSGGQTVSCKYEDVDNFSNVGFSAIKNSDGKYVLINAQDEVKYLDKEDKKIEDCGLISNNLMPVKFDGKYHYCDIEFNKVFGDYDYAGAFNYEVAAVKDGDAWYIIDTQGEKVSSEKYTDIKLDEKGIAFRNGLAFVQKNEKYIMIDTAGNRVGDLSWDDACVFASDKPTSVKNGDRWGFVAADGNLVVDYQYEDARPFSNGFAAVKVNEKWGYIIADDYSLKIDYVFEDALNFFIPGSALVKNSGSWAILKIYRLSN